MRVGVKVSKKPYMPKPPVEAAGLPPTTVELLTTEAVLEIFLMCLGKKKQAAFISALFAKADEMECMGKVSRIRSSDRPAETGLLEKRRQVAAVLRSTAELFSRRLVDELKA